MIGALLLPQAMACKKAAHWMLDKDCGMQVRIINKWVYDEAQTSCVTRVHDFLIQICAPAYCIIRWVFGCICQSLPPSLSLCLSLGPTVCTCLLHYSLGVWLYLSFFFSISALPLLYNLSSNE